MVPAHLYLPKHIVGHCSAWARSSLDQMSLFDPVRMEEATLLCQADPSARAMQRAASFRREPRWSGILDLRLDLTLT